MDGNAAVQRFRLDFEKAPILEFLNMYPTGAVELCFFHFAQANWRKVQQLGLSTIYLGDHQMKILIKSFTALAFVHPEDISEAFSALKDHTEDIECLQNSVAYFECAYVGQYQSRPGPGGITRLQVQWKKTLYSPKFWSVYNRVLEREPRTTGMVEAWHRRFDTVVNKSHPSIWQLLIKLQNEQIYTETVIDKLMAGYPLPKSNKNQEKRNESLHTIVSAYDERKDDIIGYLKGCTYNFEYRL